MRILLLYVRPAQRVDGIRDYAGRMTEGLRCAGHDAELVLLAHGVPAAIRFVRTLPRDREQALVVQYNPFSWGRWGVAPALVALLAAVRALRPRTRVVLMVHEGYVPARNLRWTLMAAWQRAQLQALRLLSHRLLVTTAALTSALTRGRPLRPVTHLPVGSNLPDARSARAAERARAGYEGRIVVATFRTGHENHLQRHVTCAVRELARRSPVPVVMLALGVENVAPASLPEVERTVVSGYLSDRELARALSSADLFLAPLADGATTRRTTLMAALQHEVAVITTVSDRTEAELADGHALALAAVDDVRGFAEQAVRLGLDEELRSRQAIAGRALYDRRFAWPVLAAELVRAAGSD